MGGLFGTMRGFAFVLNHLLGCTNPKISYMTKLFNASNKSHKSNKAGKKNNQIDGDEAMFDKTKWLRS